MLAADPTYRVSANPTVELTIQVNLERVLNIVDPVIQAALATTVAELTVQLGIPNLCKLLCTKLKAYGYGSYVFRASSRNRPVLGIGP